MNLTPEDIALLLDKNVHGFTSAQLARWGFTEKPKKGWRTRLLIENGVDPNPPVIQDCEFLEIPDFIQPIIQGVGGEHWKELSKGTQRVIAQWIAKVVSEHNAKLKDPLMQITKENQ